MHNGQNNNTFVPQPVCEVTNLVKSFDGIKRVLDGFTVSIKEGELVALIGPNGCGKSTFINCCVNLISTDSGIIKLFGKDINTLDNTSLRVIRSKIGYIFQKHNLVSRVSALSNVVHGAQAYKSGWRVWHQMFAEGSDREKAFKCLQRVGMHEFSLHRVDRLSGGQAQRVAIARALMQEPLLIFADEPTASLDPRAGEEIMEIFRSLNKQGITIIFTSHSLAHATKYSQRILAIKQGTVFIDTPSQDIHFDMLETLYAA